MLWFGQKPGGGCVEPAWYIIDSGEGKRDRLMPFVTIDYFANQAGVDRSQLQSRLAAAVVEGFSAPLSSVRVYSRPVDPADVYVGEGDTETGLPVIRMEFLPGRTLDQKRAVAQALARAAAEVLQVPVERIRTILYEKAREDWARGERLVADSL